MISPREAQRLIARNCADLGMAMVSLDDALGHVVARDVLARNPLPPFDNSAMDGYALAARATRGASPIAPVRLELARAVYAGDRAGRVLDARAACPIMTGALLPRGADAVIPVEEAVVEEGRLVVTRPIVRHRHVRRRGEEVTRGARVVPQGAILGPGALACLASVGMDRVRVVRAPRVSVITTGDETVPPGTRLRLGRIYDSNSHMLAAMLRAVGSPPARVQSVGDRKDTLARAVSAALRTSDVLIVSGGVSVGDRDYVRDVVRRQRVREVFWRVRQKPGKPLYFGVRGKKLVFGLPGNPASAYTCFCLYVYPALRRLAGVRGDVLVGEERRLIGTVSRDAARWRFLKGRTSYRSGAAVRALPKQASHMMTTLARADCLIAIAPGDDLVEDGAPVLTYRLPFQEVAD